MHIIFLNPQGNFDQEDSHLTEHPDFGGQLVYVKELAHAMAELGHNVDIVTRRIRDNEWPEFAADQERYKSSPETLRILRFPCGGDKFLEKEQLWPHIPELITNMLNFYGDMRPDFVTAHYADGGYGAALAQIKTGIPFTFTGHSLGAQKLDKLGTNKVNWPKMEARFNFSKRIAAERISMQNAARIIVSTGQEKEEQYSHHLYNDAINSSDKSRFAITPPGVNESIFSTKETKLDNQIKAKLEAEFGEDGRPGIVISSRLDEKKNIIGVLKAVAETKQLSEKAQIILCVRGIECPERDICKLSNSEQSVLKEILELLATANIRQQTHFLNIGSQLELAATYRFFAQRGSVFALTSLYEPFGLAPIEAAATGLAPVVTKNGGPSEIFADGSGVLVDPFVPSNIGQGLIDGLERHYELSQAAMRRVKEVYTWQNTAAGYLSVIENVGTAKKLNTEEEPLTLDENKRIIKYLEGQA